MGILEILEGRPVYLDTNVFIYAIEGYPDFFQPLTELLRAIDTGDLNAVTNELTLAETLVKPFLEKNLQAQEAYRKAIRSSPNFLVASVSREILGEHSCMGSDLFAITTSRVHSGAPRRCHSFFG